MIAYIAGIQRDPGSTLIILQGPDFRRLALRVLEQSPGGTTASLGLGDSIACEGETFEGVSSVLWTRRINPRGQAPIVDMPLEVRTVSDV
jgi:hypothetical protein